MTTQWVEYTVGPEGLEIFDIAKHSPFRLPAGRKVRVAATEITNLNGGRLVMIDDLPRAQIDITWAFKPSGHLTLEERT